MSYLRENNSQQDFPSIANAESQHIASFDQKKKTYDKIDWYSIISRLNDSGVPGLQIGELTGIHPRVVSGLKSETISTDFADKIVNLMQLYKENIGGSFPIYGDHNE